MQHNLDALFLATNAPGRSAFNRVERRMAPLSRELAGLILPHDHYGSHLDSSGKTVDDDLEKLNFKYAGTALAEVWASLTIDGYPLTAEYVDPEHAEVDSETLHVRNLDWRAVHIRDSQYFTQIVKCSDNTCCRPARSSYFDLVKDRFLPPPIPLVQTANGLDVPEEEAALVGTSGKFCSPFLTQLFLSSHGSRISRDFKSMPYDLFCPSVRSMLQKRVCSKCGIYHSSISGVLNHQRQCHRSDNVSTIEQHERVRPLRVAAVRQREMMAVICNQQMVEDVEWVDAEHLDVSGVLMDPMVDTSAINVIQIDKALQPVWVDDV